MFVLVQGESAYFAVFRLRGHFVVFHGCHVDFSTGGVSLGLISFAAKRSGTRSPEPRDPSAVRRGTVGGSGYKKGAASFQDGVDYFSTHQTERATTRTTARAHGEWAAHTHCVSLKCNESQRSADCERPSRFCCQTLLVTRPQLCWPHFVLSLF